jgi:signal transduction histidine kinase
MPRPPWGGVIMFRLVRFFLMTSAVAVATLALAFFLYRQNEVERLIEQAEQQNVELARSFVNTIWPQFSSYVTSASKFDRNGERTRRETWALGQAVRAVTAGLPVLKVKIYDLEGLTVYSSDPGDIAEYKANNPGFFSAAREGKPASKLTYRDTISTFEGTVQDRDLVESYLPIQKGNGRVEGVFELYRDVTPLMTGIQQSAIRLAAWFLPIFVLLYGILFLVVRHANQTIKRQHVDITEKNTALEQEVQERKQAEETLERARHELELRVQERTRALTDEIAERGRVEDEARRHRNELAHIGRISMIGEMATSLAHELNQPLTVISGCAQFCINSLRSGGGRTEKLLDAMEQTVEQADRANSIIRRVRSFIHKEDPERRAIDVNDIIDGIADLLRLDAREYDVELRLDLAQSALPVIADPIQIQQVIVNLAHNGIEAISAATSASRHLSIQTRPTDNGVVEVAVRNKDQGMSTETFERMFEPFFTTKSHGLGMGLSISRTIIEAHGGRLWATSDDSNGTTFCFTLPMTKGNEHAST